MGGGNERRPCFAALCDADPNLQALIVKRNGHQATAGSEQDMPRQPISWLFYPCGTARVKENPRGDFKGLLRAGDDHDLVWVAVHGTCGFEVRANGLPKRSAT